MKLIDTDILIDYSHKVDEAINFLEPLWDAGDLAISIITAMELLVGCRNKVEQQKMSTLLADAIVLPINSRISFLALSYIKQYSKSHGLSIPDALIAATAVSNHCPLYSKNIRHFQMIDGLTVVRPY